MRILLFLILLCGHCVCPLPAFTAGAATPGQESSQTGNLVSLNFQNIEIRRALHVLAELRDLNLVVGDNVSGEISLYLRDVPWEQALHSMLYGKGLASIHKGGVLLVGPVAEIAQQTQTELESRASMAELEPLTTELMRLRYADAGELAVLLMGGEGARTGILSKRGGVIVDVRTNSLVLTDTPERLRASHSIIKELDIAVRQVMIEARIVSASSDFSRRLGIRWGAVSADSKGGIGLGFGGRSIKVGAGDLKVDLGASGTGDADLRLGLFGDNHLLDLELSALASDGEGEVIARPRVIAANKQRAEIVSGVEIPYQEAAGDGATSTSFKKAVLSLAVKPRITLDDKVSIELSVHQDSLGRLVEGIPLINTNQVSTQALVGNGDTMVLGGIYVTQRAQSVTKTPLLGDIPLLGKLFRRTSRTEEKQELLIFITPRILPDG